MGLESRNGQPVAGDAGATRGQYSDRMMTLLAAALFIIIGLSLGAFFILDLANQINPSGRGLVAIIVGVLVFGMIEFYLYNYLFG